jgi:hypothetical protein
MSISLKKKLNPLWWFGNENDPVNGLREDGTLKHAEFTAWGLKITENSPNILRKVGWAIRNPLHNFMFYVVGLEDKPEIVNPGRIWPKEDEKHNVVLPFYAYKGTKYSFYLGWRNGRTLGAAFRKNDE